MASLSNEKKVIEQVDGSEQPSDSPSGSTQDLINAQPTSPTTRQSSLKAALDNSSSRESSKEFQPTNNNNSNREPPPLQVGAFSSTGGSQQSEKVRQNNNRGMRRSSHHNKNAPDISLAVKDIQQSPTSPPPPRVGAQSVIGGIRNSKMRSVTGRPIDDGAANPSTEPAPLPTLTPPPPQVGAFASTGGQQTGKRRTTGLSASQHGGGTTRSKSPNGLSASTYHEPSRSSLVRGSSGNSDPMGGSASSHYSASNDRPVVIGAVAATGGSRTGKGRRSTSQSMSGLSASQQSEPNNVRRNDPMGGSTSSHVSTNDQPVVIGAVAATGGSRTGKGRRNTPQSISGSSNGEPGMGGSASSHYSVDQPVVIGAVSATGGNKAGKGRRVSKPARDGLSSSLHREVPEVTRPDDMGGSASSQPGAVSATGGQRTGKVRREGGATMTGLNSNSNSNGSAPSSDTENAAPNFNVGAVQATGGEQTGKVRRQVSSRTMVSDEVTSELSRGPEEPTPTGAISMSNAPLPNPKMSSRPAPAGQVAVGAVEADPSSSNAEDVKEKIISMQSKLNDPLRSISETDTFGAGHRYMTMEPPNMEVLAESEQAVPLYSSEGASGMTLKASILNRSSEIILAPGGQAAVNTGLYVRMPSGYQGEIRPSLAMVKNQISLLFIHPTIDTEYKGQIVVMLKNYGDRRFSICDGDPIAKLIVSPCVQAQVDCVPELYGLRAYGRFNRDSSSHHGSGHIESASGHSNTFGSYGGERAAPSNDPDEFLPSARPVDENEDPEKPDLVADQWDTEKQAALQDERRKVSRKKTMMYLGAGLVLVTIVIALAVSLAKKNEGEKELIYLEGTGAPTGAPSSAPTAEGGHLLELLPEATVEAVLVDGSPQQRAYTWMMGDEKWRSYSPTRQVQRFALATVYYGTDGDNWATSQKSNWIQPADVFGWLDYDVHECEWAFSDKLDQDFLMDTDYDTYYYRGNSSCGSIRQEGKDERVYQQFWMSGLALGGRIPPELFLLTHLHTINLFQNVKLQGELPSQIGLLSDLKLLSISSGKISGSLPEELSNCTKLEALIAAGILSEDDENKLGGTIPTWLGELTELKHLWLEEQAFTGAIPSELGLLTNMVTLYLDEMNLQETIPTELGQMTDITVLSLEDNVQLSGPIPSQLGLCTKLVFLGLSTCALTGTLPTELGLPTDMHWMVAANNQLTGTIPTELGGWSNLFIASLRDNALSGQLPSQMGGMTNAIAFDLYNTNVGGQLPSELGLMKSMAELFWQNNDFSGTLPTELGLWTDMQYFILGGNRLGGTIPSQFGRFTSMTEFFVQNNELTGTIPVELASISSLVWVGLQGNSFTGEVPPFAGVVSGTSPGGRLLNITGNSFSGTMPESLCGIQEDLGFDCSDSLCGCDCACDASGNDTNLRTRSLVSAKHSNGHSELRTHSSVSRKHLNRPSERMLF